MMFRIRVFLFGVLFLITWVSEAQIAPYQRDASIKVYTYGQERTMAWCGGFNNAQFSMGDLNGDGLPDLVVFTPWNGVRTFINTGIAGNYAYAPEYALNFPPVYDYLILADYNCDGVPDLFQEGAYGFAVYTGYYNAASQLCFTFYKNLFYPDSLAGGLQNAFNTPACIPAIVDVDYDGDLDFLSYDLGGRLTLYKNMQVESGLPCDSIKIELADNCWGDFSNGYTRTSTLGFCDGGLSGNSSCLFDYDMDGDYDILTGNAYFNSMHLLLNGKLPYNPSGADSMVYQDTTWQSGGIAVNLPYWPTAFNLDIDRDGKKDLLIAPSSAGIPFDENYKCIWYYKNLSTPGVPNWQFQSDTFLIDKTIDLGTAAYPMLFDYNKDGKPDLLIGSDGYYQASTQTLRSRISYYQNTSTPGNPSFTLQTTDLLNIDSYNFQGAAPATGDIDNDGIADLILGHTDGTLSYFKNMAASDAAPPNWQLAALVLTDMNGDTINAGGNAAPFIYDIDKDGKNDLVIGNNSGALQYYQNVSVTPGAIKLKLINTHLGNAIADPNNGFDSYSTPFIGKIDSTGTDYLLMGSNSGQIYEFSGIASGDTSITYAVLDSQYSFIDTTYSEYNHPGTEYGIYSGLRSALTVGDVAGDGSLYMIVGNNKGGVELYKRGSDNLNVPSVNANENGRIQLYPNPANNVLNISWQGILQPEIQLSIINMEGQQLYTTTALSAAKHTTLSVAMLPDGLYVCVLQSGVGKYYGKFTVVR